MRLVVSDVRVGRTSDHTNAAESLARLASSLKPEEVKKVYDVATRYAQAWVQNNWQAVSKLAAELERKGKLTGQEIDRLVGSTTPTGSKPQTQRAGS
jgi:hypothetical protein